MSRMTVCGTACDRVPGELKFDRNSGSAFHFPTSTTIFPRLRKRTVHSMRKRRRRERFCYIVRNCCAVRNFSLGQLMAARSMVKDGILVELGVTLTLKTSHAIGRSIRGRAQHYSRNVLSYG